MTVSDWNPENYSRFADLRLRPAMDLLMHVGPLPPGDVIDLGCGTGVVGPDLRRRFGDSADRKLIGVDGSAAMLEKARQLGVYDQLDHADMTCWSPQSPPALIYSNAALHWVGDHAQLFPTLAGQLASGGRLAVQMPHQNPAPSHQTWLDLMAQHFPGRHDPATGPSILTAPEYHRILSPLGRVDIWETEYLQRLDASPSGHPVRHFTSSTFARPVFEVLNPDETRHIESLYDAAMDRVYPRQPDGSVLFPFRRLFAVLDIG